MRITRSVAVGAPRATLMHITEANEGDMLPRLREMTEAGFVYIALEVEDWNRDLSPWSAPPVFGRVPFGGQARGTLDALLSDALPQCDPALPVFLGGYSLAGLFSLWAAYSTDRFAAAAGVSPSVWFPGWTEFASERTPSVRAVYLSLGKKEEKARNIIMASVGDNIRRYRAILLSKNLPSILEWNEGNHFSEPEARTAKGFVWCINAV